MRSEYLTQPTCTWLMQQRAQCQTQACAMEGTMRWYSVAHLSVSGSQSFGGFRHCDLNLIKNALQAVIAHSVFLCLNNMGLLLQGLLAVPLRLG